MFPQQWSSPCGRVFCKKGCVTDAETWDECVGECNEICYKDPTFKDQQWSAYIDRSPGAENYSMECFHACVSGCGYKFIIPSETVDQVHPNRPAKPCTAGKPTPSLEDHAPSTEDLPCTSA